MGIAKGVRRIVAVTRGLGQAAREKAKAFEEQLDKADGIDGITLDGTVRHYDYSLDERFTSRKQNASIKAALHRLESYPQGNMTQCSSAHYLFARNLEHGCPL